VADAGAVVPDQEVAVQRIENVDHHVLEPGQVEAGVAAHQFADVGELVPVDA
jgi:hypothetical protein